jgi:acyl-CoA thioesterase
MSKPKAIINKMFQSDEFSKWLGIEIIEAGEGKSVLQMKIRKAMLNGFGIAHGGIVFSLADSALAFASNSWGKKSVSIEASISWPKSLNEGDIITAKSIEKTKTSKTGIYDIEITNQNAELVCLFRGIVYRTNKDWD